jgi:FlgD Ig-like domain
MPASTPFHRFRLLAMLAALAAAPSPARAATYVIPHWIEHSGSTATATYVFDDYIYMRYTPGLAGTASGVGAAVDLYLYDNANGAPLTIFGTQVCNPCTFDVGGGAPRNVTAEIGQLIASRTGFATTAYVGYAVLVARGADPGGVTFENDLVNSHGSNLDLDVTAFPPLRLRSEDPAYPGARVFSIAHMLDTSGNTSTGTYTFDETLFATYTGGQAGIPGGAGATVSLYLYDETTGAPLTNFGTTVCGPCTWTLGGAQPRKVAIRLDDLLLAMGGFDTFAKRAAGVVVVGGADPGHVTLQPWLVNAHTGPFDLATTAQVAQPVSGAGLLAVAPDDRPGAVSALTASPNPSGGTVRLAFELVRSGPVELAVFDVNGREVAKVSHGTWPAGSHDVEWDGRDRSGRPVDGGIYFARLRGGEGSVLSRVVMLR